jgi:hypothetical protein
MVLQLHLSAAQLLTQREECDEQLRQYAIAWRTEMRIAKLVISP